MSAELEPLLWPLAATMAVVCAVRWRSARRRVAMNRALHELRRPLQVLALAPPVGASRSAERGSLDLALLALDDLEGVINGFERPLELCTACARSLVTESVERWRAPAAQRLRPLILEWNAGRAFVLADPSRIAQALDNLLANAVEHGGAGIRVGATVCATGLRVTVSDCGRPPSAPRPRGPRHGHGLEVVRRVVEAHRGRFELASGGGGTTAVLELPLVAAPLAAGPVKPPARNQQALANGDTLPRTPPRGPASSTVA